MDSARLWIPILVSGGLIFLTSELTWSPATSPWFAVYVGLDTSAHMALYLFPGFFIARYLSMGLRFRWLGTVVLTTLLCVAFGVADEVHQISVHGRNAELRDIAADLMGGLAGGIVYLFLSGSIGWIREFLILSEINAWTLVKRSVVVLSFMAGTCVLSTMYAATIFDFGRAIAVEGWVQVNEAVQRYLPDARQALLTFNVLVRGALPAWSHDHSPEAIASPQAEWPSSDPIEERSDVSVAGSRTRNVEDMTRTPSHEPETMPDYRNISAVTESQETEGHVAQTDSPTTSPVPRPMSLAKMPQSAVPTDPAGAKMSENAGNGKNSGRIARRNREPHGEPHPCGSVAVIAHPGNQIRELTLDQLRRLFTGEYENWSQVGGPDLPVMVVTTVKPAVFHEKRLEMLAQASAVARKVSLPFASLVVPAVAQSQGALGLLPVQDARQRAFVSRQRGFRTIAIMNGSGAVPAPPSTRTLSTCAYLLSSVPGVNEASLARVRGASQ